MVLLCIANPSTY